MGSMKGLQPVALEPGHYLVDDMGTLFRVTRPEEEPATEPPVNTDKVRVIFVSPNDTVQEDSEDMARLLEWLTREGELLLRWKEGARPPRVEALEPDRSSIRGLCLEQEKTIAHLQKELWTARKERDKAWEDFDALRAATQKVMSGTSAMEWHAWNDDEQTTPKKLAELWEMVK